MTGMQHPCRAPVAIHRQEHEKHKLKKFQFFRPLVACRVLWKVIFADVSQANQRYGKKKLRLKKKYIFHHPMQVDCYGNDENMIKIKIYFFTIRCM